MSPFRLFRGTLPSLSGGTTYSPVRMCVFVLFEHGFALHFVVLDDSFHDSPSSLHAAFYFLMDLLAYYV
jgi:hypothetical protein